jgi:phospholipid transport system substrate-binding protein
MPTALSALLVVLVLLLPGAASAGEPTDVLKGRIDKVMALLNDQKYKASSPDEQRKLLRSSMEDFFDEEELSRRTLAVHWKQFNPDQQKQFIRLFADMLERAYIDKIRSYTNEKVAYLSEKTDGAKAVVQTKVVTAANEIPIDYALLKGPGGWKIYDVAVEGVSLVRNYRNQFNDILANGTPDTLLARMRDKLAQGGQ